MAKIIDPAYIQDSEAFDRIRDALIECSGAIGDTGESIQSRCLSFAEFRECLTACFEPIVESITEGQHPLKLDETTLQSTGKSVDIDEVIAQIDDVLET